MKEKEDKKEVYVDEEDVEEEASESEEDAESSANIPLGGSPLYPRIFLGDSAKPLMGQFPASEYVDDNINTTWLGILSFFG